MSYPYLCRDTVHSYAVGVFRKTHTNISTYGNVKTTFSILLIYNNLWLVSHDQTLSSALAIVQCNMGIHKSRSGGEGLATWPVPVLVSSLFALMKARALGRKVGNLNLFIKVGMKKSVCPNFARGALRVWSPDYLLTEVVGHFVSGSGGLGNETKRVACASKWPKDPLPQKFPWKPLTSASPAPAVEMKWMRSSAFPVSTPSPSVTRQPATRRLSREV